MRVGMVRCPYCHEHIDATAFPAHEAEHLKPRPDGQQSEYATLPPGGRERGSLTGVPKVYRHRKCGVATGMPEEIIRSYLKDPFLYSADTTFCCGCHRHVPLRECIWVETGEDLQSYTNQLRAKKPRVLCARCRKEFPPHELRPASKVLRLLAFPFFLRNLLRSGPLRGEYTASYCRPCRRQLNVSYFFAAFLVIVFAIIFCVQKFG